MCFFVVCRCDVKQKQRAETTNDFLTPSRVIRKNLLNKSRPKSRPIFVSILESRRKRDQKFEFETKSRQACLDLLSRDKFKTRPKRPTKTHYLTRFSTRSSGFEFFRLGFGDRQTHRPVKTRPSTGWARKDYCAISNGTRKTNGTIV